MPEQIKVMIVEDESIVAMDLSAGLEHDGYTVVGIADNYNDAIKLFSENMVDILLMDINIHGNTDAKTVERVKHTNPAAFLTKPYNIDNVRIAIDLALHNFAETKPVAKVLPIAGSAEKKTDKEHFLQLKDYIFIKQNYRFVKFKLSEILFAEADNNYVNIHTHGQKFALRLSLADLIDRLQFSRLVRVHRSYAVNIDEINSFDEQVIRIDKHEIPIGRNHRQEFLDHFNLR
jgi:DNA-binding LytR/AlgR family response regulator